MASKDQDIEANAARLAAEVQEATQNNRKRGASADKGRLMVGGGLFAVSAVAVLAYFFGGNDQPTQVAPTSNLPTDFQTVEGSPFGALPGPVRETVVEVDTSEQDALKAQLAAMQAELDSLRNAPAPQVENAPASDPATEARLAAMQEEMRLLTEAMAEADAQRQRELELKERELQRMRAELEAAALGGTVPLDPNLDAAAARRRAAEEVYARRAGSSMIAYGGNSSGGAVDAAAGMVGDAMTGGSVESRRISANEAFAREGASPTPVERARIIVNPANTVMQGTMIQATLETFINSDLPGQIRAVISEDVHSYDGSRVLIPRGSKVIGQYSDQVEMGQSRAMVVWSRIILPNNQSVTISSIGGDRVGQSGITGRVNTHFGSRFGSATLISLLSIAPSLALSDDDSDRAQDAADAVAQTMTAATSNSLNSALNRKPTITVPQGSQVTIMVDRDLEIF